jgi:L-tartrate/succinate antiporter
MTPGRARTLNAFAPVAVTIILVLVPAPSGLPQHAWYFFAIFAGVIAGLIFEPLPGAAVGLIGVAAVTALSRYVLFSPEQLANPGFARGSAALNWALSGFADHTVWLIFGAFVFALGYEKTGLGKRIALMLVRRMGKRTLTLGYAVMLADLILAPFTPSTTARSGGTIYPVIHNIPPLYDSKPNDPSARRIGSYLMWVALVSVCATSSLFLTGMAPNLLAIDLVQKTVHIELTWTEWFAGFAPVGILLLASLPLLVYWIYPPEVKQSGEVPAWADDELAKMQTISRRETTLAILVAMALLLWIFGGSFIDATTVVLLVVSLMLVFGVVTWEDLAANKAAWTILVWFATLVTFAEGLNQVGFVKWFAQAVASHMNGLSPAVSLLLFLVIFFVAHYLFASITAHTTALLPVMLGVAAAIPGMRVHQLALLLCFELGLFGSLTPYASGPCPIYYGSGYLPSSDFWRLGAIFGGIFLALFLLIGVPWVTLVLGPVIR